VSAYVQLAELKDMLRISDGVDDALLAGHIDAATATVDQICRRTFDLDDTPTPRLFYPDNLYHVRVDDIGSTDGLVVKIGTDGVLASTITTIVNEPLNALAKGRPITKLVSIDGDFIADIQPSVEVTARWGWPDVPEPVRSATAILAGRLFKRADSLLGVAGFGDLGAITLRAVDPDVQRMLAPFMRPAVQ